MQRKQIKFIEAVNLLYADSRNVKSTIETLNPKKMLCLSDSTDVQVADIKENVSIAAHIANVKPHTN